MGNSQSVIKVGFEDIQFVLKNPESTILLNTLDMSEQNCLILGTIKANQEEEIIKNYYLWKKFK